MSQEMNTISSFRTVFDHITVLPVQVIDQLYGKGSILDPAVNGCAGGFSGGRAASRAAAGPKMDYDESGTAVPWTCRAVVRSLSPLAQLLLMRLLYLDGVVPLQSVRSWVHSHQDNEFAKAIQELSSLLLITLSTASSSIQTASERDSGRKRRRVALEDADAVTMHPHFQRGLRAAISSDVSVPWDHVLLKRDKKPPTVKEIDQYMHDKWDLVLNYLVLPKSSKAVGTMVKRFFIRSKLIVERKDEEEENEDEDDEEEVEEAVGDDIDAGPTYKIGSRGYEFLLQNIHVQIWRFAEELMIQNGRKANCFPKEVVLRFLFQLGFCEVGQDYPVAALSSDEKELLAHFAAFGIVFWHTREDGRASSRFYPSSVACHLVDGFTEKGTSRIVNLSHFHTIVQSNFQVVAYTANSLHLRMLGLFCQLRSILPNAVIAVITRKSFMDALEDGITANQIISFLVTNAHPKAQERSDVVPTTVVDQLHLWEKERNRISYQKGVLHVFECSDVKFANMTTRLQNHGLLLWKDSSSKKVVVVNDPLTDEIIETS
mmetsp:Transcript_11531/g.13900  ORF Transcript_11531/g.13900 Transcript_11531/m.13900 type:complete len:544 (-) Transcript_11531:26-1657(-)